MNIFLNRSKMHWSWWGVNSFPSDKYWVKFVSPSLRSLQCEDAQYWMMVSMSSMNFAEPSRRDRDPFQENESFPRRYESNDRSEHCDDASLPSSDSSLEIFRLRVSLARSAWKSCSSGERASVNADSASRLCCRIFWAEYWRPGFKGGRSALLGLLVL